MRGLGLTEIGRASSFRNPATEESNVYCKHTGSTTEGFIPMIPQSQHWSGRQKNSELETSPDYLVRLCLKSPKSKQNPRRWGQQDDSLVNPGTPLKVQGKNRLYKVATDFPMCALPNTNNNNLFNKWSGRGATGTGSAGRGHN